MSLYDKETGMNLLITTKLERPLFSHIYDDGAGRAETTGDQRRIETRDRENTG